MVNVVTKYTLFRIGNVTYAFTIMDDNNNQLCVREMNRSTWHDAFRFFHELTNGSARYDDALINIAMQLTA